MDDAQMDGLVGSEWVDNRTGEQKVGGWTSWMTGWMDGWMHDG